MNWGAYQFPKNLFIFKTDIESFTQIQLVKEAFKAQQAITNWSVDIEDIDSVLRVEFKNNLLEKDVISIIRKIGCSCQVLDY
ncbi:MAG: hypothetical protein AB8B72_04700 [Crocinitomicaceae bacterium]